MIYQDARAYIAPHLSKRTPTMQGNAGHETAPWNGIQYPPTGCR